MASLISSTVWVKRGIPAQHPKKYQLDQAELDRVSHLAGSRLEQVKDLLEAQVQPPNDAIDDVEDMIAGEEEEEKEEDEEEVLTDSKPSQNDWTDDESCENKMQLDEPPQNPSTTDELAQYDLENYDKEESKGISMGAFSNVRGLQYYQDPNDDPYVTMNKMADDEDEEVEELEIYPTDNLVVVAKTEDDVSQLEIYVYDQTEENLYVHHDLLLPAMPLCLEWIDFTPAGVRCDDATRKGNFVAVGTMDPEIELWNLDLVDGLYPDGILGSSCSKPDPELDAKSCNTCDQSQSNGNNKKKKKKKKNSEKKSSSTLDSPHAPSISSTHHTSSVLSLSHNKLVRNLLLSSSADTTIKLWDLNLSPIPPASTFSAIRSYNLHSDKVQSAQWNPKEASVVLSGGWDRSIKVWDSRNSVEGVEVKVSSDVEGLRWDPFQPHGFIVTLDNGLIQSFDSRMVNPTKKSNPLWTLSAHDSSVSAFDISPIIPGLLVSGGVDKTVKVWNIEDKDASPTISMVVSRDLGAGRIFSLGFCPDDATTIAVAGSKGTLHIWDLSTNPGVRNTFGERLKQYANYDWKHRKETIGNGGVISLEDDSMESDENQD